MSAHAQVDAPNPFEVAQRARIQERGGCSVGHLIPTLEPELRGHLMAALANPAIENATIAVEMSRQGYKISAYTVSRHRRRMCACQQ